MAENRKYHSSKVRIPAQVGSLEAELYSGGEDRTLGILICHPHPQYGGSMINNVVNALFRTFGTEGFPTLRFNFRGVGSSEGHYGGGEGERQDVRDSVLYLKRLEHIESILIVGYSFGAAIGCSIVDEFEYLRGYISISYPFSFIPDFIDKARSSKPKFFVMGDRDDFTSLIEFKIQVEKMPPPTLSKMYPKVDHFWGGHEKSLAQDCLSWVKSDIE